MDLWCVYISEDILRHTKYILTLKQEYIAIPVPVAENWKGTGYLRIHCHYLEAIIFPIYSQLLSGKCITQRQLLLLHSGRTLLSND